MPDAALMRFLKPFQLGLQKVEPFHVGNDRGLSRFMGGFEIGCRKGAAQAMAGDHLVHPSEALEMMLIELARLGGAHRGQNALVFLPRTGPSGTSARHATASDPVRMAFARSPFGGSFDVIAVLPPWVCTSTEMDLRSTSSA